MMEEYQLFDELLKKSKAIRAFCEDREKMLFESIRMDIPINGNIVWLTAVGKDIDEVRNLIERLAEVREPSMSLKE